MAQESYAVQLTEEERGRLNRLIRGGKHSVRVATRARILLKVDEGWKAPQVAEALDVYEGTVYRIKRRYSEAGLDGVLHDHVQVNRFRKVDDKAEAHLIALACSPAPAGHDHWTLQLLADQMVELGLVTSLAGTARAIMVWASSPLVWKTTSSGTPASCRRAPSSAHSWGKYNSRSRKAAP